MSSGRSSSRSSSRRQNNNNNKSSSKILISEDEIVELVSKLHCLVPEIRNTTSTPSNKASANKVLSETCKYIRRLQGEMDDLSARLSQLLSAVDDDSPEAAIIRTLI